MAVEFASGYIAGVSIPRPAQFRVGSVELAVLSDGEFWPDAGVVMGIVPRVMWEPVIGPPDEKNRITASLNTLLIRSRDRTFLVDTGMGDKLTGAFRTAVFPGDYGHLPESLTAVGVTPGEIDVVINSHLHADHCGWNTVRRGEALAPYFERARYYVHRREIEDASHPNERTRAGYLAENFIPLQEAGVLEPVEGETRLTDEVTIIETPGHTEAHCSVVISSGAETAIFLGDIIHHQSQIERLPWVAALDVLPLVSMETKRALIQRALRENALLISAHKVFPGAGRLQATDGGRPKWHDEPDHGASQ